MGLRYKVFNLWKIFLVRAMSKRICALEGNKASCNCTYESCPRRGICCECIKHHWEMKELPACLFPPEIERTYNRSLKSFIEYYKKR
ncbi:MAG: DUF6485 family protein [Methanobacteriota archaeon]